MPIEKFIGRKQELTELSWFLSKKTSSLIVINGRRRIGKSRLVAQLGKHARLYVFSGLPPTPFTTKQSQLDEFSYQLSSNFSLPSLKADDWNTLFNTLAKQTAKGRIIILLDEISWMGFKDEDFLGKLKNAWDLQFKANPLLTLIICGSASAWIEKNILSSTGFLGRVSFTLTLGELKLYECNQFWRNAGSNFSAMEKFKILSITGGVPRYLEEINPNRSADENIKMLCFKAGGLLTTEFEKIFSDLFGKRSDKYKKIVKSLINGALEYEDICKALGMPKSGLVSEYINDLVVSGFISKDFTWNPKTGLASPILTKYRLKDNYLRFYLKYIESKLPVIGNGTYQLKSMQNLPGFMSTLGFQFENLVLNNRQLIHKKLNISPEDIIIDNPFFQHKTLRQGGCQIDYMIQTKTKVLYVCEIKFSIETVKTAVIQEVENKIRSLSVPRGFSVCPVLIHVNGVSETLQDKNYFTGIVDVSKGLIQE